jgi:hypothetical protein
VSQTTQLQDQFGYAMSQLQALLNQASQSLGAMPETLLPLASFPIQEFGYHNATNSVLDLSFSMGAPSQSFAATPTGYEYQTYAPEWTAPPSTFSPSDLNVPSTPQYSMLEREVLDFSSYGDAA